MNKQTMETAILQNADNTQSLPDINSFNDRNNSSVIFKDDK